MTPNRCRKLAGDRQIASTTLNIPHPYEDGMAEEWIGNHEEGYQSGKGVTFAITLKENGELVGAISIMSIVDNHQGELGYWVGVPALEQGILHRSGEGGVKVRFHGERS